MQFEANAKINLGLYIKSKRPDGYHELESIFLPIDWNDLIEISLSNALIFESSGLSIPEDTKGNLVLQAYHLLREKYHLPPLKIHLNKQIPIGAGLGGGSSDAAHMLKSLNNFFKLGLTETELCHFAEQLGSDCPFFIRNQKALARGRGEELNYEISFPIQGKLLLVVPPIHISTSLAYSLIEPQNSRPPIIDIVQQPMKQWKGFLVNDFELPIFSNYPHLATLKEKLYSMGATYASMSGSGSCLYGIFENDLPTSIEIEGCTTKICNWG